MFFYTFIKKFDIIIKEDNIIHINFIIIIYGDNMKVKLFDCENEKELEDSINLFISNKEIIDIKYQLSTIIDGNDQIYCFSAMIIYLVKE